MKINILDSSVYNRISAGEVVENPASVVKELMENAVDAGANNVTVRILDGGIKSIEVSDDGCGIPKEELYKTILPHATSKVTSADDLFTISTLGFRGEALASVSAVSDFEIRSRYFVSECGAYLKFKNGESDIEDVAIERGTTVIVNNLFYNTPARYKFLGSKSTEENAVSKLVFKFIIANPYVAVRYYADETLIYSSSGNGLKEAISSVLPSQITDNLIEIAIDDAESIQVSGYITPPEVYKNNKSMQTVVLNGRIIVDQTITATIQNAYGSRLMARCFPIYALNIVMPFDDVDVNVHPSKKEVRFANPRRVYGKIYTAVCRALDNYEFAKREKLMSEFSANTQEIEQNVAQNSTIGETCDTEVTPPKQQLDYMSALELVRGKPFTQSVKENERILAHALPTSTCENQDDLQNVGANCVVASVTDMPKMQTENVRIDELTDDNHIKDTIVKPTYNVIGQVFGTYLAIESGDKLLVIDQHAMHERILFDKFVVEIESNEVPVQPLMIPYVYEASKEKIALLLKVKSDLRECGFEISEFGSDAIKIEGIPAILGNINVYDCFNALTDELYLGKQKLTVTHIAKDKIASMACKAAIKGSTSFGTEQIELVMDFFAKGNLPLQCPHGRPTAIVITRTEFEKTFRRKV